MAKRGKTFQPDEPLWHADHRRPRTRRELISQGFRAGMGTLLGGSVLSLFADPRAAYAALSSDLADRRTACGIATQGAGKIPFICFDLAGGANFAGSNVLIGQQGGQMDFLSTAGYSKQGLPGDMIPSLVNPATGTNDFINSELGLAFHSNSALLQGILEKVPSAATRGLINGAVIPARSENDTGNNPHNPMYGINRAGADGELLALIGSRSSDSGGNSLAPMGLIDNEKRPTKVDRRSDVTGLVDVGDLVGLLSQEDTVAVMESIYRISDAKLGSVNTGITADDVVKDLVRCGYIKSADLADRYGDPSQLNPVADMRLVGGAEAPFTLADVDGDREFEKTASVAKMVVEGFAGAGTITMGGYDYHTGERATGERRDLRAGRCIGACLQYAANVGVPIMVYVFSDGSVFSNGMTDDSEGGAGKGVWTGDNQQTAASFFLVYDPRQRPTIIGSTPEIQAVHQQIGYMRPSGDVETGSGIPAANNVNLLVDTVVLNYMALHGEQGNFVSTFGQTLGPSATMDMLTAFEPLASVSNGVII